MEIISADAMQLYRGMDIGTAKITPDERAGIIHHQLDVLEIEEKASVAAYQRYARSDLEGIASRNRHVIVVGGSGLYVSGLLDELDFPGHSDEIRSALQSQAETEGLGSLREELREQDPETYATIDLNNPRRLIRALEVIRLTGSPYTPRFPRHTSHYSGVFSFAASREREDLEEAIFLRTHEMFAQGLLEETRELLHRGLREAPTASRATGYRESIAVLDGTMSKEEAISAISLATRRLAKKQRTWFRADPRLHWINLSTMRVEEAGREILRHIETASGE